MKLKTYRILEKNHALKQILGVQRVAAIADRVTYPTPTSLPPYLTSALNPLHIGISSSASFAAKSFVYVSLLGAHLCRSLGLTCLKLALICEDNALSAFQEANAKR
jgi:hypothetical protein